MTTQPFFNNLLFTTQLFTMDKSIAYIAPFIYTFYS